jgi:hypothetical protein
MPKTINDTIATLKRVDENITVLDMLLEFEKTLDNASLYAYLNWMDGELVEGPHINRYWFTTTWMYPKEKMPDPRGGMRLIKYGCKITYAESTYKEVQRVLKPEDVVVGAQDRPKKAKVKEIPVWLITIKMPRKFVDESQEGILRVGETDLDVEDVTAAWDEELEHAGTEETEVDAGEDTREGGMEDMDLGLGEE